jgi:hypothetical protein
MASEVEFRQLFCRAVDCVKMFFICRPCYRGQAYCSDSCRRQTRLEQQREANRRYQADPEVRWDHRNRQREYRDRLREGRLTDPPSPIECGWGAISEPLVTTEPESPPPEDLHDPPKPTSRELDGKYGAPSHPSLQPELHDPPKPTSHNGFGHIVCIICGRAGELIATFVHRE